MTAAWSRPVHIFQIYSHQQISNLAVSPTGTVVSVSYNNLVRNLSGMSPSPIPTSEDRRVLSPAQEAVIALIAAGSTIVAAAESAGVHRNTVLNWRSHFPHFRV